MLYFRSSPLRARLFLTLALLSGSAIGLAGSASHGAPATPAKVPVQATLSAYRVIERDGKEVLVEATSAKPGEIIEYHAHYANVSAATIRNLQPTLPIPLSTTLVGETAIPSGASATTDGATFAAIPLRRAVKSADGSIHQVLVPLLEYRALRWNLGALESGKAVDVIARVRVHATPLATPAKKP